MFLKKEVPFWAIVAPWPVATHRAGRNADRYEAPETPKGRECLTSVGRADTRDHIRATVRSSTALRHYAKQRDDPELDRWMSEIRLRAIAQIGKISKELEKAEYTKGHGTVIPSSGKYKAEQLAEAGISTSTANRYEQLAAPR
jgi:hypothetical protein